MPLSPEQTDTMGTALIVVLSLLSAYALLLRVREHFREYPDPKLTYATLAELDKVRLQINQLQRDIKEDFRNVNALVRENAEHIAALIAQSTLYNQRMNELGVKTDKLLSSTARNASTCRE